MKTIQIIKNTKVEFIIVMMILLTTNCKKDESLISSFSISTPVSIVDNLKFAEGPAYYNGNLYFSEIDANRIYKWNETTGLTVFRENSGAANGLDFDKSGNLVVCEGGNKRITSIDPTQNLKILADKFESKTFNEPNDLWISPKGDIYFTDPVYKGTLSQPGEYVYCIPASTGQIIKVISDLVRPNGIVGNANGSILYVADHGAGIIYKYAISADGSLSNKQVFANIQADGLAIDSKENLYAASNAIMVYNSSGELIKSVEVSGTLTNLCVGGVDNTTLYITTHNQVYTSKISY